MADDTGEDPTPLPLSDNEKRVLELYDRLQQLQLEIALLNAQRNYDTVATASGHTVEVAQKELLDSRARYLLRNEVVASVVSANPILQAVHNGVKASPVERDILPLLTERDATSSTLAHQNTEFHTLLSDLTDVESRSLRLTRENSALADRLLDLAKQSDRGKAELLSGDSEHAAEIARLEGEVKGSRQRWNVLKGTASAIVVGSGVDWADDAELRDIVLDPAEEEV
ncbi:putative centromere protein Cenp-H [Rosellinia necatrix]|uniref:Putative centromere protein Cenp-H n=1 Tax=Rosellinia necatrix TaxID=77044 RepID=A0A1W2TPG0_ROSNE|nr:putative centromere protein Cenp-H [Rosellinia necatrix]